MSQPLISVVVPVYNGAEHIGACIESLLAMAYPPQRVEIIIVDNNSTDNTGDVVRQYPVIAAFEPYRGPSAARNAGIRLARGEIIAFTDADCVVAYDWAREIERTFCKDAQVDAVLGFAAGINRNMFAELAQKRWEDFWFHKSAAGYEVKRKGIDTRNCAMRKRVLEQCGYFDPQFVQCEDLELSMRLNRAGCSIVCNLDMKIWHKNPTCWRHSLDKSRQRLATVLHFRRHLPADASWEDIPFPRSAFYGVADCHLQGIALAVVLLLLRSVRGAILSAFRLCLALRIRHALTFKLYKVFIGISYDMAILRTKRHETWC